jgi:hypothetical protein
MSQPTYYTFYVPWNSGILPQPGDVNGDGTPDLIAATSSGALNLFDNPAPTANGLPAATSAGTASEAPDNGAAGGWNSFLITHRGSITQQGDYDDLWALGGSNHDLYLVQNNPPSHGAAPQFGSHAWALPVNYPTCSITGYPAGWSSYTQILSPGDAWAMSANSDNPAVPSLLAVDNNGALWLFQGQYGNALACPTELTSSGWTGMTLIAPGQVDGQLQIWARNNSTGALSAYAITVNSSGVPSLSAPTAIPLVTSVLGQALTQASFPVVASAGDSNSGGPPALYAIDTSGNVWAWSGTAGTTSGTTPPSPLTTGTPVKIGTVQAGTITQLS